MIITKLILSIFKKAKIFEQFANLHIHISFVEKVIVFARPFLTSIFKKHSNYYSNDYRKTDVYPLMLLFPIFVVPCITGDTHQL
jgi:hypothetical protein